MRTIAAIFLFQCFPAALLSQTWTWQQQVSNHSGGKIAADKQHNWYSWNSDTSEVYKFDPSGTQILKKVFPGLKICNVVCTPDSGFAVAGSFSLSATVENTVVTDPGEAFLVIRYDVNGNLAWYKTGTSDGGATAGDICVTTGGLAVVGIAVDSLSFDNNLIPKSARPEMFLLHIDWLGNLLGHTIAQVFGNQGTPVNQSHTAGFEVESDASGNVLVYGLFHGNVTVDTNMFGNKGFYNEPVLMKFNSSLQLQWAAVLGYSGNDRWHSLRVNSAGDLYIIEDISSQYGISHSRILKYSAAGHKIPFYFLIGMNEGQYGWNRWFRDLQLDSCGNLYVTGFVHGRFPLDTISETKFYLLNMQVSSSAQVLWKHLDSSYAPRSGTGMAVLAPNLMLVAGHFMDSVMLQSALYGNYVVPTNHGTGTVGYFHARLHTTVGAPVNVTPPGKQQVCGNGVAILTASANAMTYWYNVPVLGTPIASGPSMSLSPVTPGNYTFFVEANSCTVTTARIPVTLTVHPLPQLTANDGTICLGESFTLSPSGAASYTIWSGPAVVTPMATSYYMITGENQYGCKTNTISKVTVLDTPQITAQTSSGQICEGETATLTAWGALTYSWNSTAGSTVTTVSPLTTQVYTVTGMGPSGCVGTATIVQEVSACTGIDEANDVFSLGPNPLHDKLNVRVTVPAELTVCDLSGRILLRFEINPGNNLLDCSALQNGCHVVKIKSSFGEYVTKVVVH